MKRKGRLKRDSESKEKDTKQSTDAKREKSKPSQSSAVQESPSFNKDNSKDTREELDFQFDEELEVLPTTGRQHDFSEW